MMIKHPIDPSVELFIKAAQMGDHFAQQRVGSLFEHGLGVDKDAHQAFEWFLKSALQGNADAQFHTARCCESGIGTEQDIPTASTWYHKAALQGLAKAQTQLGLLYLKGLGVSLNREKAIKWLQKAANQRYQRAQCLLSSLVSIDMGDTPDHVDCDPADPNVAAPPFDAEHNEANTVTQDPTPASMHFLDDSNDDHQGLSSEDLFKLGVSWLEVSHQPQNQELGRQAISLAAQQGWSDAQYHMGTYLMGTIDDVCTQPSQDDAQAAQWFEQAADQFHVLALYNLGLCYLHGRGKPKDRILAAHYFFRAAIQGFDLAKKTLAKYHLEDNDQHLVANHAIESTGSSCEQRSAVALTEMALDYYRGTHRPQDLDKAAMLFLEAAENGDAKAQYFLAKMYSSGDGMDQDDNVATLWYSVAAQQGYLPALVMAGLAHERGLGTEIDLKKAVFYFSMAAARGHALAQEHLTNLCEKAPGIEHHLGVADN